MSEGHDTRETSQDHGHEHPKHELSYYAKRIYAIRDLLLEKGLITEKDIQCQVEYQEARSPANGAKLVARAWIDPAFKARLIGDPKAACAEMGIDADQHQRVCGFGEYRKGAPHGRLHFVLLLSKTDSGPAA